MNEGLQITLSPTAAFDDLLLMQIPTAAAEQLRWQKSDHPRQRGGLLVFTFSAPAGRRLCQVFSSFSGTAVQWPGGRVVRWSGGLVLQSKGGPVAQWKGGPV